MTTPQDHDRLDDLFAAPPLEWTPTDRVHDHDRADSRWVAPIPVASSGPGDGFDELDDLFGELAPSDAPGPSAGTDDDDVAGDRLTPGVGRLSGGGASHPAAPAASDRPPGGDRAGRTAGAAVPAPGTVPALGPAPGHVPRRRPEVSVFRVNQYGPAERRRHAELVATITRHLSSDASATNATRRFELTRNRELDAHQRVQLERIVAPILSANRHITVGVDEFSPVMDLLYDQLIGLGPLGPLWRDDAITEIMVDGYDRVSIERSGRLLATDVTFADLSDAQSVARNLAQQAAGRAVSDASPIADAFLDGARVNIAYGSIVKNGLAITIRKFVDLLGMDKLIEFGALDSAMRAFLETAVEARATILVSGGTSSGKTTMINALSEAIPDSERVVTIEDALELQLVNRFVTSLQTKERASSDDTVFVTQADLLKNTLRMRPDRIIVGEIREPAGAVVMLQAASTGHEGTMTTIHANNAAEALNIRLAQLIRTGAGVADDIAKHNIAAAFDLVVQVSKVNGRRLITEIAEIGTDSFDGRHIEPRPLWRGRVTADRHTVFDRADGIDAGGELAARIRAAGTDPGPWCRA
jgi:pilus assembly protein CpaF